MRILWMCNVPIPKACNAFQKEITPYGGWLVQVYSRLSEQQDLEILYAFPDECDEIEESGRFIRFPELNGKGMVTDTEISKMKALMDKAEPDILHVFGTEMRHALPAVCAFNRPEATIVNIQGIISEIARHFCDGIPERERTRQTLAEALLRTGNLNLQRDRMMEQGENEVELLKRAGFVIGRTAFDKAFAQKVNPAIQYIHCNEALRREFYLGHQWDYGNCEKHSIFVSQASYPIKGFHYLIAALGQVKEKYQNLKVYVAGDRLDAPTFKNRILRSSYQRYIRRLIRRYKLNKNIVFLGRLASGDMHKQYRKANLYVLCSTMENSPNSLGEAMMLGVPVLASRVGGVEDFVISPEDSYVYDDTHELAAKIMKVFHREEMVMADREKRIEKAKQLFDLSQNVQIITDLYNTLMPEV